MTEFEMSNDRLNGSYSSELLVLLFFLILCIAKMLGKAYELDIHIPFSSIHEEIKKVEYTGSLRWVQEIIQKYSL